MRFIIATLLFAAIAFSACTPDPAKYCNDPAETGGSYTVQCTTINKYFQNMKQTCTCNPSDQWTITSPCVPAHPISIEYANKDFELLINQPMSGITPTVKAAGYTVNSKDASHEYDISKFYLPVGLTLDLKTGRISGTPTTLMTKTPYSVRAINDQGQVETVLTFSVVSETKNYTMLWIIIACVVIILALVGTCLFFRLRGTGRAGKKQRTLKAANTKTTSRV